MSSNDGGNHHQNEHRIEQSNIHSMHSMMMYFHFGTEETILFNFWKIESAYGIFSSCIAIIIACFCLEFIRWYRIFRKKQFLTELGNSDEIVDQHSRRMMETVSDACMHAVQLALSYSLMLIFMTFNVWLGLAIIVGEVFAGVVLSLFFPQLDLFLTFFGAASAEPCCG